MNTVCYAVLLVVVVTTVLAIPLPKGDGKSHESNTTKYERILNDLLSKRRLRSEKTAKPEQTANYKILNDNSNEWGSWSACSETFGEGIQERRRKCLNNCARVLQTRQTRPCTHLKFNILIVDGQLKVY
ncbi:uncharacterized protein LOC141908559 [Tubulanus polymorphus]|uniref:uncharacterized protein LOC141908559 n=1 Tax=Tubulanus polymorphus TaxID=672921 RepID=UPI003DA39C99